MSEREKLRELCELSRHSSTYWHENSKLTKIDTILALLARLEQSERERDAGEVFRGQMQAALGCDASEGKVWFATGLLARAETLVQREAALRTLRQASEAFCAAGHSEDCDEGGCAENCRKSITEHALAAALAAEGG
jgi:hypothetical protein